MFFSPQTGRLSSIPDTPSPLVRPARFAHLPAMAQGMGPIRYFPWAGGFLALGVLVAQAQISLTGTSAMGPFTQEQVDTGRLAYNAACGACHGPNLQGGTHRTSLTGPGFLVAWGNRSTADYFRYIQTRMPHREPNTLAPQTYAAIVAYILAANGALPGTETLTAETSVRINTITDGVIREAILAGNSQPQ
jgi:mono/diheme cytochrome c family protein